MSSRRSPPRHFLERYFPSDARRVATLQHSFNPSPVTPQSQGRMDDEGESDDSERSTEVGEDWVIE